tara:strand:+ start:275 stop:895 length:621 start_codon:yes stop_codon:yes gene_type:complete
MIKLAKIMKLRSMVYTESVKPKHKKRMERKLSLFDENLPLYKMDPPLNDSRITLKELHELAAIKPNELFVKEGDDVIKSFLPLIEKNELNVSEEMLSKIIKESGVFIYKLKYHYNRPRPYQVAEAYGIDLNGVELDSMKTPSYPSGHATQGYLIGDYLAMKDPMNAEEYKTIGEDIAHSRIIAKAHYKSDKIYGKRLAEYLLRNLK